MRLTEPDTEPLLYSDALEVGVPSVDVVHQKVHLEVLDELGMIECLQQEGRVTVAYIGEVVRGPRNLEADGQVKLLRPLEVARWDEGLGFDGCQIYFRNCGRFKAIWGGLRSGRSWPGPVLSPKSG